MERIEQQTDAVRLTVRATAVLEDAAPGDSIAVNGCCLTVAERTDETWTADVMAETLAKTGLGSLVRMVGSTTACEAQPARAAAVTRTAA